jgi:hypothetical protein
VGPVIRKRYFLPRFFCETLHFTSRIKRGDKTELRGTKKWQGSTLEANSNVHESATPKMAYTIMKGWLRLEQPKAKRRGAARKPAKPTE